MKFEIPQLVVQSYFKGYRIEGAQNTIINYVSSLDNADKDCLTFYSGDDSSEISSLDCKVLIVNSQLSGRLSNYKCLSIIYADHPKFTFIKLLSDNCLDNYSDVKIKQNEYSNISKSAYVENGATIRKNVIVYPNTSIFACTTINTNCIIQSGSVLGGSGLGDVWHNGKFHRFTHLGGLIIHNNVNIGTNVSILRGMLENTIIEEGTRIGNNVNVGHSVKIGKNCYISSGVTIGGAVVIEDNCWLAPGVTLNDHVTVGENSKIGTGSVLIKDAISNSLYLGNPARRIGERT